MRMLVPLLLIVVLAVVMYWSVARLRSGQAGRRGLASGPQVARRAVWKPAHRQADGHIEVVLRRILDTPDGEVVVEERPFAQWADEDPMWEARFAEAMANARHRCELMNAEEA